MHTMIVLIYTQNLTSLMIIWYVVSYALFTPCFQFFYDNMPNTEIQNRLIEINFSSSLFWFIMLLGVVITVGPLYIH